MLLTFMMVTVLLVCILPGNLYQPLPALKYFNVPTSLTYGSPLLSAFRSIVVSAKIHSVIAFPTSRGRNVPLRSVVFN